MLGQQQRHAQMQRKEEKNEDYGGSTKRRWATTVAPSKEVPPYSYHLSVKYQATPSRRDATSTLMLTRQETGPRLFPGTSKEMAKGNHDALQKGNMWLSGDIASMLDELTRISPENIHCPMRSAAQESARMKPQQHQTRGPPSRATTVKKSLSASPRCNCHEGFKTRAKGTTWSTRRQQHRDHAWGNNLHRQSNI
jgi:hypothetical protein